ncbi:MAG: metal-dependent hydrolase [Armatimonadetes bacterium]|nr:metal-dependent hydrolase [Akkermansiaceae bacterium]
MDWITQAALGALIGELMMGRRLENRALAWGALFGILPELLEGIVSPLLDIARELECRRALGHSLGVMALGSWGIAQGLAKIWKREKISKAQAGVFVFAVWWVHVLVDCFSVEGAALLWPVSHNRLAFSFLYPVDFLFTAPLVVTVVWLIFLRDPPAKKSRSKKQEPPLKRRKLCFWGLGLSAGYAIFALGMKFVASAGFNADLARRGTTFGRRMESPTPYNIVLWRSVVDRESEFWVGYRNIFESHATPVRWTVYPKGGDALTEVAGMRETKSLIRFTEGWWIARPNAEGGWVGDLRIQESRKWGSKKGMVDSRLGISWIIDVSAKRDHLREITPETMNSNDSLRRMAARAFGYRANWEANPRLAGVQGSLPEFLPVEE